jgi:hypothetical protein
LANLQQERSSKSRHSDGWTADATKFVLHAYGFREFLEDIERSRSYATEGDTFLHSVLSYASERGFEAIIEEVEDAYGGEIRWKSAHEWRQRHIVVAIESLAGV